MANFSSCLIFFYPDLYFQLTLVKSVKEVLLYYRLSTNVVSIWRFKNHVVRGPLVAGTAVCNAYHMRISMSLWKLGVSTGATV